MIDSRQKSGGNDIKNTTKTSTATNNCFESSRLPGCIDENEDGACLESVCQKDETCCNTAYGSHCVELARKESISCAPKMALNTCYEESPFGGCVDRRCQSLVCGVVNNCCNNKEQIGRWNKYCVTAANAICQPVVEEISSIGGDCPSGMTCSDDLMANCTKLVSQYKNSFFLGNILGGVYCGNEIPERNGIMNCPRGSYCPDPETILPCPAGYFCPYKTQEPAILCNRCKEGSLQLEKDVLVGLVIIGLLVTAYIGCILLNRYKEHLADRIKKLERRVQSKVTDRLSDQHSDQKERSDLKKLRPKLELISYRLAKMGDDQILAKKRDDSSSKGLVVDGNQIEFDVLRLFDVLDADESGDLTFDELNIILGLSEVELREFIRRMNEMAGLLSTRLSITRQVFAKYFLEALTEISNLNVSYEEAEAMFDELADGIKSLEEIHMSKFYASSMSDFLSDSQILEVISEFKRLKFEEVFGEVSKAAENESIDAFSSNILVTARDSHRSRRGSLSKLRVNRRGSFGATGIDMSVDEKDLRKQLIQMKLGMKAMIIGRGHFIKYYPQILLEVILSKDEENDGNKKQIDLRGVDLAFKNISLSIKLGTQNVDVVKEVTGRIHGKSMTALMGGSGAGKTSLLNALCGRAYYGETTGTIYLNGHKTEIQKHRSSIGFVAQDDIVYSELTVRENLLFAGRLRLPNGTTDIEIEELVDETIANLGLSRVANCIVGDVKRRGVSGGEKKRVNIGIELMAMPSILFLDEPTSGLDASSALIVMKSLNHLVEKDGVTIVSVIHQPRKNIYDLFHSLILLGVGGKLIYHGPSEGAEPYFGGLNYRLPEGESVADWLIDISSGRLGPSDTVSINRTGNQSGCLKMIEEVCLSNKINSLPSIGTVSPIKFDSTQVSSRVKVDTSHKQRRTSGIFTDAHCVGKNGITTGKVVRAIEDGKFRTALLCEEWMKYFNKLDHMQRSIYEPPEKYDLPIETIKRSFWYQFIHQFNRALLVGWRNRFLRIVNCTIVVGSVSFITALDGASKVSIDRDPNLPFAILVRPQQWELPDVFKEFFAYSQGASMQYPMKVGIVLSLTVGLTATNTLTSKRLEFFREAGSGYNLNAYFFALNILLTVEHSIQVLIAAVFATWIRHPIASNASYYIHFLLLAWLAVAWSMLFPMICSPDIVTLISGFFFSFCGLMFSGSFPPFGYKEIYEEGGMKELIAGWISPTRFFVEALLVGEFRCMPEQSGFTIDLDSFKRHSNTTMMSFMGFAGHDFNAVRWSCNGWYWSVMPVFFLGITIRYFAIGAMHMCFRAQQAKRSLIYVAKRNPSVAATILLYFIGFFVLFSATTWLFIRDQPFLENPILSEAQLLDRYGFFD